MQELIVENYGSINADFKCKKLTIIEGKEKETILRLLYLFQKTASKIKADSDLDKYNNSNDHQNDHNEKENELNEIGPFFHFRIQFFIKRLVLP